MLSQRKPSWTIFVCIFATINICCISSVVASCTLGNQLTGGTCVYCPKGYHSGGGSEACTACLAGKYNDVLGGTSIAVCKDCPMGSYGEHDAAVAATDNLIVGSWTCLKCTSGKWSNTVAVSDGAACVNCMPGKYSFSAGATSDVVCKNCAAGRWSNILANNQIADSNLPCYGCLPGKFTVAEGSDTISSCERCGAGKYNDETGQEICKDCIRGRYAAATTKIHEFTINSQSINELTGADVTQSQYNVGVLHVALTGNTTKVFISAGIQFIFNTTVDLIVGSTTISNADLTAKTSILQGPGLSMVSECTACSVGKYLNSLGFASDSCLDCPTGFYSNEEGTMTPAIKKKSDSADSDFLVSGTRKCGCSTDAECNEYTTGDRNPCPEGLTLLYITCKHCEKGKYLDSAGHVRADACKDCPSGTFQDFEGKSGLDDCKHCGLGKYGSEEGATQNGCVKCVQGTYGDTTGATNSDACKDCPEGRYGDTAGLTLTGTTILINGCKPCQSGRWSSLTRRTKWDQCTACVRGKWSSATAAVSIVTCQDCGPGKYGPYTAAPTAGYSSYRYWCKNCPTGRYSSTTGIVSDNDCLSCPVGRYGGSLGLTSPDTGGTATACQPCPMGTYSDQTYRRFASECKLCPLGRVGTATGLTIATACSECGTGRYTAQPGSFNSGQCLHCPLGRFNDQAVNPQAACPECGVGKYTPAVMTENADCNSCPLGKYSDQSVNPNMWCKECGTGKYTVSLTSVSSDNCLLCAMGKYNDLAAIDQNRCKDCPSGRYGPTPGLVLSTDCTACITGKYSTNTRQIEDTCIDCQLGQYQASQGANGCVACVGGKYAGTLASVICIDCDPGYFTESSISGSHSCDACVEGKYAGTQGAVICQDCAAGSYQTETSQTVCQLCVEGQFQLRSGSLIGCSSCYSGMFTATTGSPQCKFCPPGQVQYRVGQTACELCELGKFEPVAGRNKVECDLCEGGLYAATTGQASCANCAVGTFQNQIGQTSCVDCPVGFQQSSLGALLCLQCAPGKFNNEVSLGTCKNCPAGYFQMSTGAVECDACEVGKYQPAISGQLCYSCPPGTFNDDQSQSICKNCIVGRYQPMTGITAGLYDGGCHRCPAGYYQNELGSASCETCPLGWTQPLEEQNNCNRCQVGRFQNKTATATCDLCDKGQYTEVVATVLCKLCPLGWDQHNTEAVDCDGCVPGRFANVTGTKYCVMCFRGRYSNVVRAVTADVCMHCTQGLYLDEEGKTLQAQCKRCPKGRYQTITGAPSLESCTKCPNGTYADTDTNTASSDCKDCSVGRFSDEHGMIKDIGTMDDPSDCKACLLGRFGPNTGRGTIEGCKACVKGKYNDIRGSSTLSSCKNCPAGKFGANKAAKNNAGTWTLVNKDDPDGELNERVWTVNVHHGNFTAVDSCQPCFRGRYSSAVGITTASACVECGAGKYQDEFEQLTAGACESCPPGAFINETGAKSSLDCESCRPGRFISARAVGNGPVSCGDCGAGRFQDLRGEIECKFCPSGYFGAESGKSRCAICETGQYQSTMDSKFCYDCPSGRYGSEEGLKCAQFCAHECKACVAGLFMTEEGAISGENCENCPVGRFSEIDGRSHVSHCKLCRSGYYNGLEAQAVESACLPCALGRYADEFGMSSATSGCKACPIGRFGDEVGNGIIDRCKLCAPGLVGITPGLNKSNDCTDCIAGRYSTFSGISDPNACKQCGKGRWSNTTAAAESRFCLACPKGRFQNETGGDSMEADCTKCPIGRASASLAAETIDNCIACPAGKYMDASATSAALCKSCPKGFAQPNQASFDCIVCPVAKYSPRLGSPLCLNCRPGTYGTKIASHACKLCQEGTFAEKEASLSCDLCEIGKYNNCRGSGFCFVCERGTTTYDPGSTFCVLKRIESVPAKIIDEYVYEDEKKQLCVTWELPEIVPDPTQLLVFTSQTVSWSTNRLFPPTQTNTTSLNSTTTSICVPTQKPLFDQVVYMRITPIIDDATGTPSPPTKIWAITSTCDDESYLDADHKNLSFRKCVACPPGGDCRGLRRWQDVTAIFGWFRLHNIDRLGRKTAFWRCFKASACLGSRNPKLEGRYLSTRMNFSLGVEIDLARLQVNPERCNIDHGFSDNCTAAPEGRCRLCRGCARGYWPKGHANCELCPTPLLQTIAVICGVLGVSTCLYLFLQTALADAGVDAGSSVHLAQPMQKIALNHMQLVALAASFPLQWPPVVESLFATFGVLGDAGDYIFNPACAQNSQVVKGASLFFQKQLLVLLMPLMGVASSAAFWLLVKLFDSCTSRRNKSRTKKLKQQTSNQKNHGKKTKLIDASDWPTLQHPPTFLDKHIKTELIDTTLYKAKNQPITYAIPNTFDFIVGGIIVEWVDRTSIINFPSGHTGCWKVLFPNKEIVYMTNTEAVAGRKRHGTEAIERYVREHEEHSHVHKKMSEKSTAILLDMRKKYGLSPKKHQRQKQYDREIQTWDKFIATAVTVLYLLYPTVTKATFKLVACQTVGVNRYLQMDLDLLCWNDVHLTWVILLFLPALFGYVFGLPGCAFYFMHKNRNHLHHRIPRFHFGTLFLGFKHEYYFWECITAARKTIIIMVAVFLTSAGTEIQALTALMVNLTALVLHMNFRPYIRVTSEHDTLHGAEMWALLVSFVTFWMGLFFFQESVRGPGFLSLFLTIILMCINIIYVLVAMRWYLILKLIDLDEKAIQLRREGLEQENKCEGAYVMRRCLMHLVPEYKHPARNAKGLWRKSMHSISEISLISHLPPSSKSNATTKVKIVPMTTTLTTSSISTAEIGSTVGTDPSLPKINGIESIESIEIRVDALVLRAGMNQDILQQQLIVRHEQMLKRIQQRNQIRKSRLQKKIEAETIQTKAALANGKEVNLPSIPEARIDAIVLRAQMGAEIIEKELDTRKTAMLHRLALRNKKKLKRVQQSCASENAQVMALVESSGGCIAETIELPAANMEDNNDSLDVKTASEEELLAALPVVVPVVVPVVAPVPAPIIRGGRGRGGGRGGRGSRGRGRGGRGRGGRGRGRGGIAVPSVSRESTAIDAEQKLQLLIAKEKQHEQQMADHMNKSMTDQHDRLAQRIQKKKSISAKSHEEIETKEVNDNDKAALELKRLKDLAKKEAEDMAKKEAEDKATAIAAKEAEKTRKLEEMARIQRQAQEKILLEQETAVKQAQADVKNPNQYETLMAALETFKANPICDPMGANKEIINQVETYLKELERMYLLKVAIAQLNQKVIAEIRSFDQPKPEIVDCMRCVFLLLGTPEKDLRKWKQLRGLIGKMGKDSLKRKINQFTLEDAKELSNKVIKEARNLNAKVDVARVIEISVGASTFFAWCKGVLEELGPV